MSRAYTYKKSIDSKIVKAVSKVLNTQVETAEKINQGIINHVYKVVTSKGIFIARVFRHNHWPENGKLEWIEKQLRKHKIPHAKAVYFSRDSKYFPYGFMITEYVSGLSGWDAINRRKQTFSESFKASGLLLKKIHKIRIKKFGEVNHGKGTQESYIEYEFAKANKKLNELIKKRKIKKGLADDINSIARRVLISFSKRFKPVLVHGDANRDNSIFSDDGQFILIDWDNASSRIPLWDYFVMSSWWLIVPSWKNPTRRTKARKAFFQGYGNIGFTQKEITEIQPAIHLLYYVGLLKFYNDRKEASNFKGVLKAIKTLLEQ